MLRRFGSALCLATLLAGLVGCGFTSPISLSSEQAALSAKSHKPGELELQIYPDTNLDRFLAALKGAKKSIQMEMYMLTLDTVVTELINAANRGVSVQVMLEANPFNPNNPNMPLPTNKITANKFKGSKVQLAWSDPSFNFTHAKCVLVDDDAWIFSLNLTKSGSIENREFAVIDHSPSDVAELKKIFKSDWIHDPYRPTDPDLVISPINSRSQILDTIKAAKQELIIGIEVAGDAETDAAIADRIKAGVKVRAIFGHYNKISSNLEQGKKWRALGADVRFIKKPYYHAKYIVADGKRGYLGSVNLTTNSMDKNREIGVIMQNEPNLLSQFQTTFDKDWQVSELCPQ